MTCDFCGGHTKKRKTSKQHLFQGRLYRVENVTAEVCTGCGERYFSAKALDAIDELLGGKHRVKKTLRVEVVSL